MGKASKWIRNFLLGKKDNKKRSDITLSLEYKYPNNESLPGTSKVKRKWSFGKLASKGGRHKFSMSFDSIETSKFSEKVPPELVSVLQNRVKASVVIRRRVEILAATKIQAAFRAYLARKALHALRGLVKLQALVRGHIVRKQTASMMKQMHALMSIQVRARFHRIQVADQTQLAVKSQSSMDSSFVHNHRKQANVNPNETRLVSKCTSDHLNLSQVKMIDVDLYSDHLSISKQGQYKEYSLTRVVNSPRLLPSYMINTESSRAKARSQSEPKQRPKSNTRQRNKQTEIKDDITFVSLDDPVIKRSSLQCKPDGCAKTVPWFSSLISHSNYYESLPDYESNFKLY